MISREDFNCTIQELKHVGIRKGCGRAALFQLHHTGIKTVDPETVGQYTGNFNCTIQELKQERLIKQQSEPQISIAPYRN